MWPGIIKYTRTRVGHGQRTIIKVYTRTRVWSCGQVSLNIQELELVMWPGIIIIIQELELVMWPGIIKYTRTRVGQVARYH